MKAIMQAITQWTRFVMNAEALGSIMNDLFGNVVYSGIDTDKHKYPIGSGRVTFSSKKSYMKAVQAAFVEIKTPKFTKKVFIHSSYHEGLRQRPSCWNLIAEKADGRNYCHLKPMVSLEPTGRQ
jgi:hypothetical protein